jgi:hypothetical protein
MYLVPPPPAKNEVKRCDVDNCPCCNAITRRYATPKCYSAHDAFGKLSSFSLHWNCGACGCEWAHGQFGKEVK